MIELTPNKTPEGEQCGTCRFAGTHTVAEHRRDKTTVRCRRFPPFASRPGAEISPTLADRLATTNWPYTTWDDWCGEWVERDPEPDDQPEPAGFRL